jgi:hypothetical protein
MTEDVHAEVRRLRSRCDQAREERIRAEHVREQAEAQVAQASAAILAEFGVDSPEQVRAVLSDLDRQIADEVQRIEHALGG